MFNVVRSFDLLEGSPQSQSVLTSCSEASMFAMIGMFCSFTAWKLAECE